MSVPVDTVVICAVITRLPDGDVDTRVYDPNGIAIIGKDGTGDNYHLGQISSSVGWAKHDIVEHFRSQYDQLFPQGWSVSFEYR